MTRSGGLGSITGVPMPRIVFASFVVLLLCLGVPAAQAPPQRPSFEAFLNDIRVEAASRGISETTLDTALANLAPEPVVVARDRAQPELTMSLDDYVTRRLTIRSVAAARTTSARYSVVLTKVEAAYGVPSTVITAVWGLESNYGVFTGTYNTIRALATLAYDGRRALFRKELLDALTILDQGDVPIQRLKGSWAGAMGQPQFMPSTFLGHAVDFDGDGRRDIWSSVPDVLASMANYLKSTGWNGEERWGREVALSAGTIARVDRAVPMRTEGCRARRELSVPIPLTRWGELGVTLPGGKPLPAVALDASLVRGRKRHFLVYGNYEALLDYNCSNAYAISVGLLADRIRG